MRRLAGGLLAVALVLGGFGWWVLDPVAAPAARRAPEVVAARLDAAPMRVSLFGDSLTYQARNAFVAGVASSGVELTALSTRPGAALCDDRDAIVRDLMSERPDLLVLEYSGNSFTPCMADATGRDLTIGSVAWRDRYRADVERVATIAGSTGTTVVWATAPPVAHGGAPPDYPARIASLVRELSSTDPALHVADTGHALAGPDGYSPTLPCRPDELARCRDGRIVVRAADGLHFDCVGAIDGLGGCLGYSAGARRYGAALAEAVGELSSSRSRRP